ncbi:MAG: hypothetical protein J7K95_04325 [Thermoplasmata archaeon]|nr:hypothetical protein [Thermoplasmata archaeon]
MEYEMCPYCGKEVESNELYEHMITEHMNEIRKEEFIMLDEMKQQHYELLLDLKRNHPSIFVKFIEELAEEENEKIKILCMKELISMREFEKGEKLFRELISKNNKKEIWLEYIIMLNKKGKYEKSIETCLQAMKIFDDEEFQARMKRIIEKARARL